MHWRLSPRGTTVRTIRKRSPPSPLTQWRAPRLSASRPDGMECTYEEMRRQPEVLNAVENSLLEEQGRLCAYTGHRIDLESSNPAARPSREVDFHVEHLTPQVHSSYGQETDYANLVACWLRPNCGFEPSYGARKKGDWPSPAEQSLFVSPLRSDCSQRFVFNRRGEIKLARVGDTAAEETIRHLALSDPTLTALRREAIRGALAPRSRPLRLSQAQRLLSFLRRATATVDGGGSARLMPYCFAIEQAVEREIKKLQAIGRQP